METNQKERVNPFYKVRGYAGCVNEGIRLLTSNFLVWLKYLLPVALIYSLFATLFTYSSVLLTSGPAVPIWAMVLQVLLAIVSVFFVFVGLGAFYTLISHAAHLGRLPIVGMKRWAKEIRLNSLLNLQYNVVVTLIYMVIVGGLTYLAFKFSFWILIAAVIIVILFLPLFSIMEPVYMLEKINLHKAFRKSVHIGFRHWGAIFLVALLAGLLMMFCTVFCSLPASIMQMAIVKSNAALAIGDITDIPTYIDFVHFIFLMIAYFCSFYLMMLPKAALTYLYFSIETEGSEQKKMKEQMAAIEEEKRLLKR